MIDKMMDGDSMQIERGACVSVCLSLATYRDDCGVQLLLLLSQAAATATHAHAAAAASHLAFKDRQGVAARAHRGTTACVEH